MQTPKTCMHACICLVTVEVGYTQEVACPSPYKPAQQQHAPRQCSSGAQSPDLTAVRSLLGVNTCLRVVHKAEAKHRVRKFHRRQPMLRKIGQLQGACMLEPSGEKCTSRVERGMSWAANKWHIRQEPHTHTAMSDNAKDGHAT